jgi:hypothetical protein
VHNLASKLTPRADARTVEDEDPRHNRQQRADAAEEAARGAVAEAVVHLGCDEGEDAACMHVLAGQPIQGWEKRGGGDSPRMFLQNDCAARAELA